jgi:peptide/nickel transport system permease protein
VTGYIIRRLIGASAVVGLLTIIVFLLIRSMPGDALLIKLGETGRIPESQMEELRAEMGLDDPLVVQYTDWALGIARGDFGESLIFEGRSVGGSITNAFPTTAQLAFFSIIIGLVLGVTFGTLSAVYRGGPIDYITRLFAIFGLSAPLFWVALVVILYGALWFNTSVNRDFVGFSEDPVGNLRVFIVPSAILGLNLGAVLMRYTRSAMLEVLRQDYMRTATAKGLPTRRVVMQHGLRNAFIPIVTLVGTQAAVLLGGSVLIEFIFRMPGLGLLTYNAILTRDYPLIQGATLFIGVIVVLTNLVVDLAYGVLDPRVRYS